MNNDTAGPYIVWENHGYDGWHPKSFKTLKEALVSGERYSSQWVLTKSVSFDVQEVG